MEDGSTSSSILASGTDGAVEVVPVGGDRTGCSSFIRLFGDSMRFRPRFLHRVQKFTKTKVLNPTGKLCRLIKARARETELLTG